MSSLATKWANTKYYRSSTTFHDQQGTLHKRSKSTTQPNLSNQKILTDHSTIKKPPDKLSPQQKAPFPAWLYHFLELQNNKQLILIMSLMSILSSLSKSRKYFFPNKQKTTPILDCFFHLNFFLPPPLPPPPPPHTHTNPTNLTHTLLNPLKLSFSLFSSPSSLLRFNPLFTCPFLSHPSTTTHPSHHHSSLYHPTPTPTNPHTHLGSFTFRLLLEQYTMPTSHPHSPFISSLALSPTALPI